MNILYLAHRIPYPPNKGDKIRSFNEIKYLAKNHTIDLVCLADDPEDIQHEKALQDYCRKVFVLPISTAWSKIKGLIACCFGKSISVAYFHRNKAQTIVNQWLAAELYDAVICFSSSMAEYVLHSPILSKAGQGRVSKRPKLIMDFCDVDSDKWLQYSRTTAFPLKQIYRAENVRLKAYEKKIYKEFDASILISDQEKELFLRIYPKAIDVVVMPNGVDTDYFTPQPSLLDNSNTRGLALVFTGAMDYHANIDGVCWFCEDIFPMVRDQFPEVQLYIVGRHPAQAVKRLGSIPGVHVIGHVDDIRPWYQKADILIAPMRLGRGAQNKVLEAMAMGKAVVSTTKANAGIGAADYDHLRLADSPNQFCNVITEILQDNDIRINMGHKAREFVIDRFNWPKNMQILNGLLQ